MLRFLFVSCRFFAFYGAFPGVFPFNNKKTVLFQRTQKDNRDDAPFLSAHATVLFGFYSTCIIPRNRGFVKEKAGFLQKFYFSRRPAEPALPARKACGTLAGGLKDIFQHQFIVGKTFHEIAREKVDVIEFGEIENMRF